MSSSFFVLSALGIALSARLVSSRASSSSSGPVGRIGNSTSAYPTPGPGQHVNKSGDIEDTGNLRTADWARRWEKSQTGWHRPTINPTLVAHAGKFRAQPKLSVVSGQNQHPAILVPLCGKTVDLLWLWQQGWKVVGIEIVTQAIIDFFHDNSAHFPQWSCERLPNTSPAVYRYATPDGLLQIFQADIFSPQLTKEVLLGGGSSGFDVVWDRASLIALNPHTRARYVSQVQAWLQPHAEYLLNVCSYDQTQMHGPPFSVPETQVHQLFAHWQQRTKVEEVAGLEQDNGAGRPKVPYTSKTFMMANSKRT